MMGMSENCLFSERCSISFLVGFDNCIFGQQSIFHRGFIKNYSQVAYIYICIYVYNNVFKNITKSKIYVTARNKFQSKLDSEEHAFFSFRVIFSFIVKQRKKKKGKNVWSFYVISSDEHDWIISLLKGRLNCQKSVKTEREIFNCKFRQQK